MSIFSCQFFMSNFIKSLRIFFLVCMLSPVMAQVNQNEVPMIGAEIFIEPGQTPAEIDTWFRLLKESGMSITRIRMFESYMHKPDGNWDYSLFDLAFKAGEKYNIKIYGNLFPATSFEDIGGFKFPKNDQNLQSIADYIKHTVTHFKQFSSLYGWVPINEPGNGGMPKDEFSKQHFSAWKSDAKQPAYESNGYQTIDFSEQKFLLNYNTWFLKWLAGQIHQYDPGKPIHVNNHAIFQNIAEYDFPEWRKFLTSLGASAHASWHFGYFNRDQYAMAMSANSEIIRSGAGHIPWLMTELQGGNNTYSGFAAMCPTKEEIAQWLWTVIGTGGRGGIFWSLNPRSSGFEAGEWALLNFQDEPSDRMKAAAGVAKVINNKPEMFAGARVEESGINILYTRESLWIEKKLSTKGIPYDGRDPGGAIKSSLGYFEALSEMGVQSNFKSIDEFDFSLNDYTNKVIILAQQLSIPSRYWKKLEDFSSKGGKLIIDGLTGYYDENAYCILKKDFPLQKLFGGNIKEFKVTDSLFEVKLNQPALNLSAHLWTGSIKPTTAVSIGFVDNQAIATRNNFGRGTVLWIPSLVGLGSRISGDYRNLAALLSSELKTTLDKTPFRFEKHKKNMLMKTLRSGSSYITIIINKSKSAENVNLDLQSDKIKPTLLYADKDGTVKGKSVQISAEETIVVSWE